ncbi:GspH/FimT family pseudopilin [Ramlibacter rhizophilus]|uniref:Type II secretion system protein H n=1 Tax=Ramlibacter rhizophilus TaxID=1781167 RepID=A0A4Z0BS83_9BURK|nr:GspH/FimT family pseudopilin [Ramlibacter rhizophilus]TFZ01592.1 prepilin-type N-terminal cleavage/methylation domain-containing protein [Ramlibacter rhizophilus]
MLRPPSALGRRCNSGFTLLEMMVAVALLALVASLAAPGMQRLIAAQRLRSVGYDLVADLTLARSEAIKRAAQVSIVPTSGSWANGWTVQTVVGSTALGQRGAIHGLSVNSTTPPAGIVFEANGRATVAGGGTARFGFSNSYGNHRCITVDPSGRPRSVTSACTTSTT